MNSNMAGMMNMSGSLVWIWLGPLVVIAVLLAVIAVVILCRGGDERANGEAHQGGQLELWIAGLSIAAGLIHLAAAPEHLAEWWGYGYFFLASGVGQVLYGEVLFRSSDRSRHFYAIGLFGTLAIIALYAVTRSVGIPFFGPGAGEVEAVGALDIPSKLVEIALAGALTALLWRRFAGTAPNRTPHVEPITDDTAQKRVGTGLSRRALLSGSAGTAAGLLALFVGWGWRRRQTSRPNPLSSGATKAAFATTPPLASPAANGALQVALTVDEVEWELAPGKRVKALTYNGQVPGPLIRLRQGERLQATVTNRLSVPTTVHWHGVDVPNPMDGIPDLTQPPIQPGESFLYEFDANPAGTRWYHTHYAATKQQDRGLYAPLIIDPATPESRPPDREYTLVFSAWVTGFSAPVPAPSTDGGSNDMSGMMGGIMSGSQEPLYDTFAVNGKAFPATAPLTVKTGERVHLRLINASGSRTHLIYLEGHRLQVTHTDGNPLQEPVAVDVVPIAPAERYDVEFTANRPGVWSLHDLTPGQTEAGLRVQFVYAGQESASEAPLRTNTDGLQAWSYPMGRGVDWLPAPSGTTDSFKLTLSGGMMGSDQWTINGKTYPHTDPLPVHQGDRARLQVFNMSMETHPMHLHGHSFRITSIGGAQLAAPLIKDVVAVQPMETAMLEFVADNPGNWMFHCHKPMHMEGGMVTLVRYQPPVKG